MMWKVSAEAAMRSFLVKDDLAEFKAVCCLPKIARTLSSARAGENTRRLPIPPGWQ